MNFVNALIKHHFQNSVLAFLLNAFITFLIYLAVQPDPKGLGFFIYCFGYASFQGLVALIMLFLGYSPRKFFYSVVLWANFIFVYYTGKLVASSFTNVYPIEFNSAHAIAIIGSALFVWLSFKFLRELRHLRLRSQ